MNYQAYPNLPNSYEKSLIYLSSILKADQLKEGDKLYPKNFSGECYFTISENFLAKAREGEGVSIHIKSAYFKNYSALALHNSIQPLIA